MERLQHQQMQLATIRDRSAAQILDLTICGLLFWYVGIALARRFGGIGVSAEGLEIHGTPALLGATVFATGTFLYFFAFESIFNASLGKMMCRLRVQTEGRRCCAVPSALVRNILRPVDAFIGLLLMAGSDGRQTFGDRVAATRVVKVSSGGASQTVSPGRDQFATWEARMKASLIDVTLLSLFALAYLFATRSIMLDGQVHVTLRGISLLVLVDLVFFYFVAFDGILGGTVGKVVSGLRVVRIDGAPSGFSGATLRAACRPVDLCTAGILPFVLVRFTSSRQHLGDLLAGTVVIHHQREGERRFWAATAALCVIAILAAYPLANQAAARLWPHLVR